MAPPAKRRKRNVVEESEDEADTQPARTKTITNFFTSPSKTTTSKKTPAASESPSPVKRKPAPTTRASRSNGKQPRNGSASSSPKKPNTSGASDDKSKTSDLKTLFSKQAQRAAQLGTKSIKSSTFVDDPISDPISGDDEISEVKASSSSLVGQHARKRAQESSQISFSQAPSASQRFLRPSKPPPSNARTLDDDLRPWSERFGPKNLDELVVHKKKVADVRRWLDEVLAGRLRQRLLVLKGPAGAGKTITVRLLANELGYELLEWKNPTGTFGMGLPSASALFDDFLGRGAKFGTLDTQDDEPAQATTAKGTPESNPKRIILVEEFPNTFQRSSTALNNFRESLLRQLDKRAPSSLFASQVPTEPVMPIIMVISETLLTTTSASADSFTAHRLLGPEILRHPSLGMIEFNAIAPTLLAKALELVVQKEARISGRRMTPGPLVLKQLGEIGDIRSAISSLEFLCLKGDEEAEWGAKVAFTKQKKAVKDGIRLTQGEVDSLELISQREASLGIFHAVGKVVYNKRDDAGPDLPAEDLPLHLSHRSRPKRSEVSVDTLIDETGTDTHTFISALHENYVLSCDSADPMDLSTSMDYVNECIEYISQSDLLCPSRDIFHGGRGGFGMADSSSQLLRQDEITFQVAVRGLLYSLPNPVKRKTTSSMKGGDAFKMFYPASIKLWRAKEEIEGLVDMWSTKLLRGEGELSGRDISSGAHSFVRPQSTETTSWLQRQQQKRAMDPQGGSAQDDTQSSSPLLSLGSAARRELLLERLPYMTHIARSRKTGMRVRDLEKIVSFKGTTTGGGAEDDEVGEEMGSGEAWATDKPSDEASPRKKRMGLQASGMSGMLAQKLVLSDDDIED